MRKHMKKRTKGIIVSGLVSGLLYAGFMAGYDYYDNEPISILKFIFNALFFGILMGVVNGYLMKKQAKKNENQTGKPS